MKTGILLINLGTPDSPAVADVRRYLREFLNDPRVIDLPTPLRLILLYAFILPFRPKSSAHAYQAIWTKEGSPLLVNSKALGEQLQAFLGEDFVVAIAMRYGSPSIAEGLSRLQHCDTLKVLPLYPQYSSAASGSSIQKVLELLAPKGIHPSIQIIRDFYQHPAFIRAQAELIAAHKLEFDFIVFSYHAIPQRQLAKACPLLCVDPCPVMQNTDCYRAQCYGTTQALVQHLQLPESTYLTAFQSRLGKTPWIKPYIDEALPQLASQGIKKLAICCPSFVADCLETLEEMNIRARQQWLSLGGESFTLIPCVNASTTWVKGLAQLLIE